MESKYLIFLLQPDGTRRYLESFDKKEEKLTDKYYMAWNFEELEEAKHIREYLKKKNDKYKILKLDIKIEEVKEEIKDIND